MPSCAVVMVNYRTPDESIACIRSLVAERENVPDLTVTLVDNASGDGSPDILALALSDLIADGFVTLLPLALNGGFGWANNQAILRLLATDARPDFVMVLNPDCIIEPGAIRALIDDMRDHPHGGACGSLLLNPDGGKAGSAFRDHSIATEFVRGTRSHRIGRMLGLRPIFVDTDEPADVAWVAGAACLFRTAALEQAGLFDDGFFLYFEEVELLHRLRQHGWSVRYVPTSRVMHIGGVSTGVRSGDGPSAKALPRYWFESRRRYLARTSGAGTLFTANIAWLVGDLIARVTSFLPPSRRRSFSGRGDRAQLLASGLTPRPQDAVDAIARVGDAPGAPPRWQSFKA
ncbi:hypothetical protein FHS92_000197 [Sphingobium subterraneum]|uniref:Glycosyltransferase n=2 Tax=Sphingobium subterraneum TaxID=627688 RepID=A0A841IW46_9SPHN|nr:glycosyltransferase family 2 protein [Sphingobium subterraneum]MBB6122490.1 hypothetical protein [Sphingobium subterraneum]